MTQIKIMEDYGQLVTDEEQRIEFEDKLWSIGNGLCRVCSYNSRMTRERENAGTGLRRME